MKRTLAVVIGFAMLACSPGLANADPRPPGHQQAVDLVITRALAQRGVPYTYGGGDATGPTRRPASVPSGPPADPTVTGLSLNPVPATPTQSPGLFAPAPAAAGAATPD